MNPLDVFNSLSTWIQVLTVGFIWGSTNSFLAASVKTARNEEAELHSNAPQDKSILQKWLGFWLNVFSNKMFWLTFALNQLGSVLFIAANSQKSVGDTFMQPMCQTSTFLFTAITSAAMGEKRISKKGASGIFLIIMGIVICSSASS